VAAVLVKVVVLQFLNQVFQEALAEAEVVEENLVEQVMYPQLAHLKEIQVVIQDQAHLHNSTMAEVAVVLHKQESEELRVLVETAVMVEQLQFQELQYQKLVAEAVEQKAQLPQEQPLALEVSAVVHLVVIVALGHLQQQTLAAEAVVVEALQAEVQVDLAVVEL
jgi:hypothetical protein